MTPEEISTLNGFISRNLKVEVKLKESNYYEGENQNITVQVRLKMGEEVISESEDWIVIDRS